MQIEPKIFRAYDIRGLDSQLSPELAERVGRAMVKYTGSDTVVVGRDMRVSSPELTKALIKGIVESGADVVDIGLATSPLFYYAVGEEFVGLKTGAGVMVTASHNPPEYNGFKLERGDVTSIGAGSGMDEFRDLVLGGKFRSRHEGSVLEVDLRDEFAARHLALVKKGDIGSPTVVFDAGNGMAGHVAPIILKAYGLDKRGSRLFFGLDGRFPNHLPNPIKPENLVSLAAEVVKIGADLGVAYDGDADRVGFVDEKGERIRGDVVTALIAEEMLARNPGGAIVYDAASGRVVPDAVKAAGGTPVMSKVGHSFMKLAMRERQALMGGEASTHYYFKDFFYAESSDLAMLLLLARMNRAGKRISELVAPFRRYCISGEINFEVKDKEAALMKIDAIYGGSGAQVYREDGLRFDFPDWWFGVRPSNTEPLLRLNVETGSEAETGKRVAELSEIIKSV